MFVLVNRLDIAWTCDRFLKMEPEPKENSELLYKLHDVELLNSDLPKPETNGVLRSSDARGPPDGGFRAYSVLVGSFLTNGLLFGVINSCSVMYGVLEKQTKEQGIENAESKAGKLISLLYHVISNRADCDVMMQFTVWVS